MLFDFFIRSAPLRFFKKESHRGRVGGLVPRPPSSLTPRALRACERAVDVPASLIGSHPPIDFKILPSLSMHFDFVQLIINALRSWVRPVS